MIKAVLFDMDDLLLKTEKLIFSSYMTVLRRHGVELTERDFFSHWTKSGKGIEEFIEMEGLSLEPAKVRKERFEVYKEITSKGGIPMFDGVNYVLSSLSKSYRLALVSSSWRNAIDWNMKITGLAGYFSVIVSGDDTVRKKPDPECFLKASTMLRIEPSACIAVDDAVKGIVAAKRAGMKTIWIPTDITKDEICEPDMRLDSIKDITREVIESV